MLICVCGVLGLLAPVHRCARSVCCVACAVSWASWLLFTGAPARCVVLRVRCPGPPGSCSPLRPLGVLCCVCGVLGLLAPVHRCARSVCCFACAVSWAFWLLFTGAPARCVVLRVQCPGPPGSCSPVCPLGVLFCVSGVLGHLAPVQRCARAVCCVACAVSWASWLLFTGVPARCVVFRVPCPGPLGSCSPVRPLGVLFCVCGVLGLLAPVHRCARSVCCVACAVSWASWLLFTGVSARCVVLRVRCPGPPGSCSPVCPLGVLFCVCGVLGLLAPVHRCARSVCCFACAVSWASLLLFTVAPARCVVLRVRCPRPPGSCSPVRPLSVLFCVCGVLGLLAPVHRCARSVCCFACAVSWASWHLFTGAPARCVVLRVRCPGPPGSCSPVRPLGVLCCVCGVLGLLAPVHRCACSVCCVACAVSWASWLLFTGAPARCVVLRVRCPGPPGSCSPVCPLGVLFCVCGVLGLLAPVHRCARSVCCFACAVSWGSWLLFTGVPARCVVLRVRCPEPPGCCSPVRPRGVLFCVCGVLGLLAPVHRCARSVCCFVCAVSWASWLLFTVVPAPCVVLRVWCPGPSGSCSPVRPRGVLFCVCGVLGLLAPVHRCARSVCCFACAVSWASWLLFTGAPARCVVLRVRCPGPPGSCSPVRPLGVLFCVCGVLGLLAPVHRCARSVCCCACAVSWASWLLFTGVPARYVLLLCGASLRGAHSSIRTAADRSRQGLGTLQAHTRPSGWRLFLAGRAWVPSGRALVHPDGSWRACACSLWPGRADRPPGRVVVRLTFSFGRFFFPLCLAPSGLWWPPSSSLLLLFFVPLRSFVFFSPLLSHAPVVSGFFRVPAPGALGLGAVSWLFFLASRCLALRALSPRLCLSLGRWLLPAGSCPHPPLPFCVSRFSSLLLGALVFFFLLFSSSSSVRPRCLRLPLVSGPGCPGPRRCALFALLALRFSALRALSPLPCFPPGRWLLPGGCCPPPPPCVSRFSSLPLGAVCRVLCCAVLCVPGCDAAPRCCALCRPVLCCRVLCCFAALVWCGCLLRRALSRCSSPWGPVLCGAVFCGVPPRCVLSAVCVLSWRGGACCCSPLCFVLGVSRGAVLCVPCPLRSVRCCASLCWCARVVLFVWCVLLLAPGAVVRCCVLCCFLWCAVVWRWVWWPVVVCWWRVSVSVSLSGRVVCFPVVGVVCCGALLSCVVFCGAVLSRGAVALCSAVVLRCCWGLLCPPVACRAVLCCAVGWLCCFLPGGGVCVLWCSFPCAVRSLSSPLCALRWLAVLAVVPCFPVSCAVALCCRVVLCCCALLSLCGAVCVCSALLRPAVRRRAVLCCAVGCLCCFLPGGGVCVLWCPFPPCRHAQRKHQSSYMSPRVGGGVLAGMP